MEESIVVWRSSVGAIISYEFEGEFMTVEIAPVEGGFGSTSFHGIVWGSIEEAISFVEEFVSLL